MDNPVGPVACKEDSPVKQPLDFAKDCTDHSNESGPVSEFFLQMLRINRRIGMPPTKRTV